jgi:hypothetical protein
LSRPYDLDLDVQRVLQREQERARENALLAVGPQLELFLGDPVGCTNSVGSAHECRRRAL